MVFAYGLPPRGDDREVACNFADFYRVYFGPLFRHISAFIGLFSLVALLSMSFSSQARAACVVGGNNVKCDTCAEMNGIEVKNLLRHPGSNNNFCRVVDLQTNQTIRVEITETSKLVGDANTGDVVTLSFDENFSGGFTAAPASFMNIIFASDAPNWNRVQSFTNDGAAQDTTIGVTVRKTNPSNPDPISGQVTCFCDGGGDPDPQGTIRVRKKTEVPPGIVNQVGDNTFTLVLTPSGGGTAIEIPITVNGQDTSPFSDVTVDPGSYTFSEILPPNPQDIPNGYAWEQKRLRCRVVTDTNQSASVTANTNITIGANDVIACTAENKLERLEDGKIIIKKKASGVIAPVKFEFEWLETNGETLSDPDETFNSSGTQVVTNEKDLTPGTYVIKEKDINGWSLDKISCNDDNSTGDKAARTATIIVEPGETVTCTFENSKERNGKIIIKKKANDVTDPVKFEFEWIETNGETLSDPDETFNSSGTQQVTEEDDLKPGTYVIKEKEIDGWTLDSLTCREDRDQNSSGSTGTRKATIELEAGETVVCTYENSPEQKGKIIIKKEAVDVKDPVTFEFEWLDDNGQNLTDPSEDFTQDGVQEVFVNDMLESGTYVISEKTLDGWDLESVSCRENKEQNSSGNAGARKATIQLEPGEIVQCIFKNKRKDFGKIILKKTATGVTDPVTFDFNWDETNGESLADISKQFTSSGTKVIFVRDLLPVGEYSISEAVVDDWLLTGISCNDANSSGDKDTRKLTINLEKDETVVCTFSNLKETDDPMDDITKKFIKRRVDNLLSHDPDRSRIIRRLDDQQQPSMKDTQPMKLTGSLGNGDAIGSSKFSFSTSLSQMRAAAIAKEQAKVTNPEYGVGALGFGEHPQLAPMALTPQKWDFWMEGHISHYEDGAGGFDSEGDFGVLYAGVDYSVNEWLLIGALVQFDWTDEDVSGTNLIGNVDGKGWMAGPYVGIKLSDRLYFSARAAWGQSDNDIDVTDINGHRTGSFDTERWLASAELSGNWHYRGMRITPSIQIAYGNEDQEAYKNNLGQKISGNDITIGRLKFGPEFAYSHEMEDGTVIEPHLAIEGIWNFDTDDVILSNGENIGDDDFRGRVTGGVIVKMKNGTSLRLTGNYDGIGDDDLESYGGQLWFSVPLN